MECLKCGKTTNEVFCESCRAEMEQYPVNPGTPISIPDREAYFAVKRANRPKRKATAEEQNATLQKLVKFLLILWLLTAAALAVFILLWIFF